MGVNSRSRSKDRKKRKSSRSPTKKKRSKRSYSRSPSNHRSRKERKHHKRRSSRSRSYSPYLRKKRGEQNTGSSGQKHKRNSKFQGFSSEGPGNNNGNMGINNERLQMINNEQNHNSSSNGLRSQNSQNQAPFQYSQSQSQQSGQGGLRTLQPIKPIGQQALSMGQSQPEIGPDGVMKIPTHLHKNYKHGLRIYCGNIPDGVPQQVLEAFIADSLIKCGGCLDPGSPVFSSILNPAKKFIFLQMRSIEEATALLQLDGIVYQGRPLRLRRPKDFNSQQKVAGFREVPTLDLSKIKIQKISTQVENSVNKLWITNIPEQFYDQQIIELLQQFGELKSFHLAQDKITSQSKGYAFCEFQTTEQTDLAIQKLNGLNLGSKQLQIKRSENLQDRNAGQSQNYDQMVQQFIYTYKEQYENMDQLQQQQQVPQQPQYNYEEFEKQLQQEQNNIESAVLKFNNLIDQEKIEQDEEYEFIYNDFKQELQKIGTINQVVIPRIKDGMEESGVGKVYVEFLEQTHAQIAKYILKENQYDNKILDIEFYDPRKFADQIYI